MLTFRCIGSLRNAPCFHCFMNIPFERDFALYFFFNLEYPFHQDILYQVWLNSIGFKEVVTNVQSLLKDG